MYSINIVSASRREDRGMRRYLVWILLLFFGLGIPEYATAFFHYDVPFYGSDALPQRIDRAIVDQVWELAQKYAMSAKEVTPPRVNYIQEDVWEGGSPTYAEYDSGFVFLYHTLWRIKGSRVPPGQIYILLAEEFFHHLLAVKGVPFRKHHCTMVIQGFASRPESGSFLELIREARELRIVDQSIAEWTERRLGDACTKDLRK